MAKKEVEKYSGCKTMIIEKEKEIREVSIAKLILNLIMHISSLLLFFWIYSESLVSYIFSNYHYGTLFDHPEVLIVFLPCIVPYIYWYFKPPLIFELFRINPKIKVKWRCKNYERRNKK